MIYTLYYTLFVLVALVGGFLVVLIDVADYRHSKRQQLGSSPAKPPYLTKPPYR
jgi:hypothetical protein